MRDTNLEATWNCSGAGGGCIKSNWCRSSFKPNSYASIITVSVFRKISNLEQSSTVAVTDLSPILHMRVLQYII